MHGFRRRSNILIACLKLPETEHCNMHMIDLWLHDQLIQGVDPDRLLRLLKESKIKLLY